VCLYINRKETERRRAEPADVRVFHKVFRREEDGTLLPLYQPRRYTDDKAEGLWLKAYTALSPEKFGEKTAQGVVESGAYHAYADRPYAERYRDGTNATKASPAELVVREVEAPDKSVLGWGTPGGSGEAVVEAAFVEMKIRMLPGDRL